MRIVIESDADAVARAAAERVAALLRAKPACSIALPTGSTPVGLYRELVRRHRAGELSFARARAFQLDEYVDLEEADPASFAAFLRTHLFAQVDFAAPNLQRPDGAAPDLRAECERYEEAIRRSGGLDLAILGIGADGHVAFNEPGSSLASRTRVKTLTRETRRALDATFGRPTQALALTLGVGTILEARSCLLLALGGSKAAAVEATVEGPVCAQVPASALQLHPAAVVILDEAAAGRLARRDYYREMESAQRELEASGRA